MASSGVVSPRARLSAERMLRCACGAARFDKACRSARTMAYASNDLADCQPSVLFLPLTPAFFLASARFLSSFVSAAEPVSYARMLTRPPAVAEVLGLYGLIVALILNTRVQDAPGVSGGAHCLTACLRSPLCPSASSSKSDHTRPSRRPGAASRAAGAASGAAAPRTPFLHAAAAVSSPVLRPCVCHCLSRAPSRRGSQDRASVLSLAFPHSRSSLPCSVHAHPHPHRTRLQ